MECKIYSLNLDLKLRNMVGKIRKHTDMNNWLKVNGEKDVIYEIWKSSGLHSRWKWKEVRKRWGKMATPQKKHNSTK